jgi:hypothetical protein
VLSPTDLAHFADRGYVRVAGAFTSVQAASMRDVVWDALARDGIVRNDPSTWTVDAPATSSISSAIRSSRRLAARGRSEARHVAHSS